MFQRTRQRGAKVLVGLVIAGTLAGGVGVAVAAAAPGGPRGGGLAQEAAVKTASPADLSETEKEHILFMREEEKLARDVYRTFFDLWGQPLFENIARSEQAHMDAIETLIEQYGLRDPVTGQDVGEFVDEDLQALYDDLVREGSDSLADALRVGALIEEIDILDLQASIDQTDALEVEHVYENLMRGSRNHLRALVSTLERHAGEVYEPQELSPDAYDAILAAQVETGRSGERVGRGAQGGRGSRSVPGTGPRAPGEEDGRGAQGGGRSSSRDAGEGECLQ